MICSRCGKDKPLENKKTCIECRDYRRNYYHTIQKDLIKQNREKRKQRRITCKHCGKGIYTYSPTKEYCNKKCKNKGDK